MNSHSCHKLTGLWQRLEIQQQCGNHAANNERMEMGDLTMEMIKYNNERAGQYFFEPATMRFFNSKVYNEVYDGEYFVTSEKGPDGVRKYTVRRAIDRGAKIETIGEFQQFDTLAKARAFAKS